MSRLLCDCCQRPMKSCICRFIYNVNNTLKVIVLQHPNEVSQAKGSLTLLANSLNHCTVIVGEDFSENKQLNQLISYYQSNVYLLYPHEQATSLNMFKDNKVDLNNACLLLIDATWKKAYRMFMLSKNLRSLQKIQLPIGYESLYKIRKTTVVNGLSTLEACCYALSIIEQDDIKYLDLIENFKLFNDFLISFRKNNIN